MKTSLLLLAALAVGSGSARAQSTAETQATHMVRAAGMPLNDGTLPPGMLTVRVVEGAFTRNLTGQTVALEVQGGRVETATTGSDGRAQFAHLPIGGRVRVSATVSGERLASDLFDVPVQSGVRVLLVAGGGPTPAVASPSGTEALPVASTLEAGTAIAAPVTMPVPATGSDNDAVLVIRTALITATVTALGFVLFGRRSRQR